METVAVLGVHDGLLGEEALRPEDEAAAGIWLVTARFTVMCAISAVARRERFVRKPAGDRERVEA